MMRRCWLCVAGMAVLSFAELGRADDHPPPLAARRAVRTTAAESPLRLVATAKRKRVEQSLEAPLGFCLDGRKSITLAEFIAHVREQHGISIRIDSALGQSASNDMPGCGISTGVPVRREWCEPAESPVVPLPPAHVPAYAPYPASPASPPALRAPRKAIAPPPAPAPSQEDCPDVSLQFNRPGVNVARETKAAVPPGRIAPSGVKVFADPGADSIGIAPLSQAVRSLDDAPDETVPAPAAAPAPGSLIPPGFARFRIAGPVECDGCEAIPGLVRARAGKAAVACGKSSRDSDCDAETHGEAPRPACCRASDCRGGVGGACCGRRGGDPAVAELVFDVAECCGFVVAGCAGCPLAAVQSPVDELLARRVSLNLVSLEGATVDSGLRQLLEALSPPGEDAGLGIPVRVTCAADLDCLVQDDGVLVTTRLNVNVKKETRVYKVPRLPECPPDQVARLITRTVRPWSWRTQVNEIADQFVASWPRGGKMPPLNLDLAEGVKLAGSNATESKDGELNAEEVTVLGPVLSATTVAMVQSGLAAIEILHHADPPTGVIETLPGVLVITQSQGAHREIAELLEQLQEAAAP